MPYFSSLHRACANGHTETASLLIHAHRKFINHESDSCATPLMAAASSGHLRDVMLLVQEKADLMMTNQEGKTALWLAAQNGDIDLYQTDVIWAPQLADHFVDMTEVAADLVPQHFESVIQSQTVNGQLVALPLFTDAPALYYRTDLLEKHGAAVPTTWEELTATAQAVQDAERAEGNSEIWGFVFQGNAYEGLTCNALEWETLEASGRGRVYSWIASQHPTEPDAAPRIVVLLDLEEGVRFVSNLVEIELEDVHFGLEVELVFVEYGEQTLPQFRPVGSGRPA